MEAFEVGLGLVLNYVIRFFKASIISFVTPPPKSIFECLHSQDEIKRLLYGLASLSHTANKLFLKVTLNSLRD